MVAAGWGGKRARARAGLRGIRLACASALLMAFVALILVAHTGAQRADAVETTAAAAAVQAAPLSLEGFSDEAVLTTGLAEPIAMEFLPDGRMLVLQKGGQIKIGDPSSVPMTTEVYLTLTDINTGAERGLLDIALDPDFVTNGYFYLYYHPGSTERGRIARFTHAENAGGTSSRGEAASEAIVWQDVEGYGACCHYGGGLDFGPDGNLWLTVGDKFDGDRAQDLSDPSGKIIRVEPDGDVPADNPYASGAGGAHPYVWASGLRNPFRASWDAQTNRFFIGEVGGNDIPESWEDLHVARYDDEYKGLNYQWPNCEGPHPYTDFPACTIADGSPAEPIFAYPHHSPLGPNASITAGFVYRGTQFPSEWDGVFFYGDYTRHVIRYLVFDESGENVIGDFDFKPSGQMSGNATTVVAIEQGTDGALYYAQIANGQIRRIVYEGGNRGPTVTSAQADVTQGTAPLAVEFSAEATDPDGDPLAYTWHFGDGTSAVGAQVQHTYTADGPYHAYVSVSDGSHTVVSASVRVQVGTAPTVTITSPVAESLFRAGQQIQVAATATDDGPLDPADYAWTVQFGHDNHFHPGDTIPNGTTGSFHVSESGHDYSNDTWYRVTLAVTDEDGLVTTDYVDIRPDKVDVTFATAPEGLVLHLDTVPKPAPWVHDTLIDFEHQITARSPQCVDGTQYVFDHWSDGGAASHTYTVPDADATLTATFEANGSCDAPVTDGLVMRLQGDQGVTTSEGGVIAWSDLSGKGNNLGAISGTPTVQSAALSGHDVISFDGVDDGLGRTGFTDLPVSNADRSVFAVVKYDGASASALGGWAGFTYGAPYNNQVWGPVRTGNGDLGLQGWGGGNDFTSDAAADGEGWLVHSIVMAENAFTQYRDGNVIDTGEHQFQTGTDRIRLGTELAGGRFVDMEVAEILVYDRAVTEAERQQIEDYLNAQYFSDITEPRAVTITSPQDGRTLRNGDVEVAWSTAGDLAPGDHAHVTLDDGEHVTVMELDGSHTFANVADGVHQVTVQIASEDHVLYDNPEAIDTVEFTVDTAPATGDFPLDGLVLHLESDLNVIRDGSNNVGGWLDQSGRGNDLDKASGDPTVGVATTPSGVAALSFDGDGDALQRIGSLNGMPTSDSERTVVMAANYGSTGWGGFSWGAPYCGQTFGAVVALDGDLALQGWCWDRDSGVDGTDAGWLVQSIVYGGGEFAHYRGDEVIDTGTVPYSTADDKIVLGAEIDGSPDIDMQVAAILVYNRELSAAELAQTTAFLESKYLEGTVEQAPPTTPTALAASAGDGAVSLTWKASSDPNGDLTGYRVFRAPADATIDPATDAPLATVTAREYVDTSVANGTAYRYAVVAYDAAGHQSDASNQVVATPEAATSDCAVPFGADSVLCLLAQSGVSAGANVTAWADLSGQGNDLVAIGNPTLTTTPTGVQAIALDGNGDALRRLGGLQAMPLGASARTVVTVARYAGTGWGGFSWGAPYCGYTFGTTVSLDGDLAVQGWCWDHETTTDGTGAGWLVQAATYGQGQLTQYRDGVQLATGAATFTTADDAIWLGAEIDGNPFIAMDVAAVVVFDRVLSAAQVQTVSAALQATYLGAG
ncbi:PQQ-dependent sugar dehydrogenase [Demequina sp.]|uniref:PQQ-dependent sugar dehydrogenase n=1 Tax=Demequina sp. TaxID=2050685 RepID=UPI003A85374C